MRKQIGTKSGFHSRRVIVLSGIGVLHEPPISKDQFPSLKAVVESEHANHGTLVEVIYKIGRLGDPRAVVPLYHRLSDRHADVRRAAATSLGNIGASSKIAKAKLLDMFNDKDEELPVRAAVAGALSNIGEMTALQPLIRSMDSKRDEDMHSVIACALGNLGDKRALPPLERALRKYEADKGNPARSILLRSIAGAIIRIRDAQ
ncbi:HEAT repeats [uncultured archaeon]|nr:HEAT repeats [uncultured archaeon]